MQNKSPSNLSTNNSRSFQYASPRLWNQIPNSCSFSLSTSYQCSRFLFLWHFFFYRLTISSSVTTSLFHSRLKIFLFLQILPTVALFFFLFFGTDSPDSSDCLYRHISIFIFYFFTTFLALGSVR